MVKISRDEFANAYNKVNKEATGRKARSAEITRAYNALVGFAEFMDTPNAVPVFFTRVSKTDGKLDWDIDTNYTEKLDPTHAYVYRKRVDSAPATP